MKAAYLQADLSDLADLEIRHLHAGTCTTQNNKHWGLTCDGAVKARVKVEPVVRVGDLN